MVFDETIIGDSVTVPVVIGERRGSGGNNINIAETRQARLGCSTPFFMPDETTPFRIFIFNSEDLGKKGRGSQVLKPAEEDSHHNDVCRLYLSSDTGFLNKILFEYIVIKFAMCWKCTQGPVDCLLISDNLPVHKNKDLVQFAESTGIHVCNIMPGTSHWFQVHDQQPFSTLKKKMNEKKFEFWTPTAIQPEGGMNLLIYLFYQAEMYAFETKVLQKTFDDVGLWPWNPGKILNNCRENCPAETPLKENHLVKLLLKIIDDIDKGKSERLERIMRTMKKERVITQDEILKKKG